MNGPFLTENYVPAKDAPRKLLVTAGTGTLGNTSSIDLNMSDSLIDTFKYTYVSTYITHIGLRIQNENPPNSKDGLK